MSTLPSIVLAPGYPERYRYAAIALHLDGCSTRGIALYMGVSPATIRKWLTKTNEAVSAHDGRETFLQIHLDCNASTTIKTRTAEGPPDYVPAWRANSERVAAVFADPPGHVPDAD